MYVRCTNDANTTTIEYCTLVHGIEYRWSHIAKFFPTFTISATPYAVDNDAVGWFTDFSLLGKGLKEKDFNIKDYVSVFSCAVKTVGSIGSFVLAPTPDSALKTLKQFWKFTSDVNSLTKSVDYSSGGKNTLTYVDSSAETAYRAYKVEIASPIRLQKAKDYLEAHIYLYKLHKAQSVAVKLSF